jgi:hypothetical protein
MWLRRLWWCRRFHGAQVWLAGCGAVASAVSLAVAPPVSAQDGATRFEEVGRFSTEEATQGVAVDAGHFYAISNRRIGKYDKHTGQRVGGWEGAADGPIIHLDSGVVLDGLLYCAHSNYPGVPMVSSIEIFETDTLTHVGSHSFGIFGGSATWVDRADGFWWVAFGHYAGRGGVPDQGPAWTNLAKFDDSWRRVGGYVYPGQVVERFQAMSNSGGAWGEDGRLYATGHDEAIAFVLSLPTAGSVLDLQVTLPLTSEGQGIAWDRTQPGTLYSILRSSREVVVSTLR